MKSAYNHNDNTMAAAPRILIVKLSAIGDCLHATPALAALRQTYPNAHIGWAVHSHCAPVITSNPNVDKIHRWDRRRMLEELLILRKSLRREHYDIAIDLQGLWKSGFVCKLSGARRRIGPAEAREMARMFYTERVKPQEGAHILDIGLNRVAALGAKWDTPPPMHFPVQNRDLDYADLLIREACPDGGRPRLVILNPGAGKPNKQWPPESFARFADALLAETDVCCLITGGPGDKPLGYAIMAHMKSRERIHNLVGRTGLTQLAALIHRADLFIGGDTGPMHISQAVGTPVLALFGPTDPLRNGPRSEPHRFLHHPDEPADVAMHRITVDEVLNEAKDMLGVRSASK